MALLRAAPALIAAAAEAEVEEDVAVVGLEASFGVAI
jgi:hypothetical protein